MGDSPEWQHDRQNEVQKAKKPAANIALGIVDGNSNSGGNMEDKNPAFAKNNPDAKSRAAFQKSASAAPIQRPPIQRPTIQNPPAQTLPIQNSQVQKLPIPRADSNDRPPWVLNDGLPAPQVLPQPKRAEAPEEKVFSGQKTVAPSTQGMLHPKGILPETPGRSESKMPLWAAFEQKFFQQKSKAQDDKIERRNFEASKGQAAVKTASESQNEIGKPWTPTPAQILERRDAKMPESYRPMEQATAVSNLANAPGSKPAEGSNPASDSNPSLERKPGEFIAQKKPDGKVELTPKAGIEQKTAGEILNMQTCCDDIFNLVSERGSASLDQISSILKLPKELVESIAVILDENKLLELYYPAVGEGELRVKNLQKPEEKSGVNLALVAAVFVILAVAAFAVFRFLKLI